MTHSNCMALAAAALIMCGALTGCDKTQKPKTISEAAAAQQSAGAPQKVEAAVDATGDVVSDSAITAKAKWALAGTVDFKSIDISVETVSGRVTLSGLVDSEAESQQAAAVVSRVDGVKAVDNRLVIKTQV